MEINRKFKNIFNHVAGVRYYLLTGGRFSSKSFTLSAAVCLRVNNDNAAALYTRYTLTSAKDSIIPEFNEKLELLGLSDYYKTTGDRVIGAGKRKVVFKGLKTSSGSQTAKLKGLKDFSIFVLDEAEEENDEESFDKINYSIRTSDRTNMIILALNPSVKTHWIYKRFFEDTGVEPGSNKIVDNVSYIHTTYLDVYDRIPNDYKKEIEALKERNPEKYNHLFLGHWLDRKGGVIFQNWIYSTFDNSLPFGFGLDFGYFPDPDTLIQVAIDKKLRKIYVKAAFVVNSKGVEDLAFLVRLHSVRKIVYADSSNPRLISDLNIRDCANVVPVKKWAGSVNEGIKLIQDFQIIVDPGSPQIGSELNNYVWSDKKNGVPIDAYNHTIDAIRYYVQSTLKPFAATKMRAL
jgi:phage terminase large subunit